MLSLVSWIRRDLFRRDLFRPRRALAVPVICGLLLVIGFMSVWYPHHPKSNILLSKTTDKIFKKPGWKSDWAQHWNPTPIQLSNQPPTNDTVFDGLLPRFWSSGSNDDVGHVRNFTKPEGVDRVVGLVFFGRRDRVSILDCYLRRNLVKYGGTLDEVIFLTHTRDKKDLRWLDRLVRSEPAAYTKSVWNGGDGWSSSYDMVQNQTLYVKIDDDVVFIDDAAIPILLDTKVKHPEYYLVGANVVNQPLLSWLHFHLSSVHPYLPELQPSINIHPEQRTDWRASGLPTWQGPADMQLPDNWTPPLNAKQRAKGFRSRWLPVRDNPAYTIDDTPVQRVEYYELGTGWSDWAIAAQVHYSFFENIEKNELWRYRYGIWDFNYQRMGIQFMVMLGEDINNAKPFDDDEKHFSQIMTKRLKRHGVVDGRALVSHYSFAPQREGLENTDVLERYRTFAKEHICETPMLQH